MMNHACSELGSPQCCVDTDGVLYGVLIDIFEEADCCPALLLELFRKHYPNVYIGRADRFYRTVQRIVAPCRPSILGGKIKISGVELELYRRQVWIPRIRNKG